jgi:hypothetical protein
VTLTVETSSFGGSFEQNFSGGAKLLPGPSPGCLGAIGDFVWHDLDRNGIQDGGEPDINGARVVLTLPDGVTKVSTVTTNRPGTAQAGYYQFANLYAGTYAVSIDQMQAALSGLEPTITVPDSPETDSHDNPSWVEITSTAPGHSDQTIDVGFVNDCQAEIGDRVWIDTDKDGIQNDDEVGIDGVQVDRLDQSRNLLESTETAAGGLYVFAGLCPGDYRVRFIKPGNYTFTPRNEGDDTQLDSDAHPTTGVTDHITIADNRPTQTVTTCLTTSIRAVLCRLLELRSEPLHGLDDGAGEWAGPNVRERPRQQCRRGHRGHAVRDACAG